MNKTIKVSICIPAYKQTDYLRKSLESILIQKYYNFEVIITDDSPDDSVKKLIEEFDFKGKLKYYKNEHCLGTPENWNKSINLASGEYIKILHHDDWFKDENSLSCFVEMLDNNPNTDFAFSASEAMSEDMLFVYLHKINNKDINRLKKDSSILYFGNLIGAPSATIYRKNTLFKYDVNLKWLVDIDFYIQILNINNNLVYSPKPLVQITAYGQHQVTRTAEKDKLLQAKENIYLYKKIKNNKNFVEYILFLIRILYMSNLIPLIEESPNIENKSIPKDLLIIRKIRKLLVIMKKILIKILNIRKMFQKEYKHLSYSQCGEDIIIKYIFDQLKIKKPSYIDIGAYDPFNMSNTYLLYKNGSHGLCIEPNPILFKKIKKYRKKDICLNIGIKTNLENNIADFYVMSANTLSTFSKTEADRFVKEENQKIEYVLKIPVFSINKIIEDNFKSCPNFISLDIEGLDFEVLKDLDFKRFKPEILCIETLTFTENATEKKLKNIIDFMEKSGYFVYADTYINTIFVNKEIWLNRNENN